jgi:hypothetical protein
VFDVVSHDPIISISIVSVSPGPSTHARKASWMGSDVGDLSKPNRPHDLQLVAKLYPPRIGINLLIQTLP